MMPSLRVNKIRGYTSISIINRYSLQQTTLRLQRIDNFSSYQRGMQCASNHPAICVILRGDLYQITMQSDMDYTNWEYIFARNSFHCVSQTWERLEVKS